MRSLKVAVAVSLILAAAVIAIAFMTEEAEPKPIRNVYYPFTVEVEVWDVGANPWDHKDRPTDLDKV